MSRGSTASQSIETFVSLMSSENAKTLTLTLPSTFDALERAVEAAQEFLASQGVDEELAYNVVLLVSEAVTNAMEHGNQWEAEKHVTLTITSDADRIEASVTDQGEGFDVSRHPRPFAPENMLKDGGRGRFLMQELADELRYDKGGRRVQMIFHVRA